jgi:hypothetical protein
MYAQHECCQAMHTALGGVRRTTSNDHTGVSNRGEGSARSPSPPSSCPWSGHSPIEENSISSRRNAGWPLFSWRAPSASPRPLTPQQPQHRAIAAHSLKCCASFV